MIKDMLKRIKKEAGHILITMIYLIHNNVGEVNLAAFIKAVRRGNVAVAHRITNPEALVTSDEIENNLAEMLKKTILAALDANPKNHS